MDSPTGLLHELGKYFADEHVALIMDYEAEEAGWERGEVLAHGSWFDVTHAFHQFHEKHPTTPVMFLQPGLLPRRRRQASSSEMEWIVPIRRHDRYSVPLVQVMINGYVDLLMALSPAEPSSSLAPEILRDLRLDMSRLRGRRVIPSDSGPVIAPMVRSIRLELQVRGRRWLELPIDRISVAMRPYALGVGGMLGLDVLERFPRVE